MVLMRKIICLLLVLFLCSCESEKREEYYNFKFDDYNVVVGYDNVEYLKVCFETDIKDELEAKEEVEIDLYLLNSLFAKSKINNFKDKTIESNKAVVTYLDIFLDDLGDRKYMIDDIVLDKSIKSNCDKLGGTYIERNGVACLIEKQVNGKNNAIVLKGDYLNIDQDQLERIEISVK